MQMKATLWLALILSGPAYAGGLTAARAHTPPAAATQPLLRVMEQGGLTPQGLFHAEFVFLRNGAVHFDSVAGHRRAQLTPAERTRLIRLIGSADYPALRAVRHAGPPASAMDGADAVYTFSTPHGVEVFRSAATQINPNAPLFQLVERLMQEYGTPSAVPAK